jgi:hypothetical protein
MTTAQVDSRYSTEAEVEDSGSQGVADFADADGLTCMWVVEGMAYLIRKTQ